MKTERTRKPMFPSGSGDEEFPPPVAAPVDGRMNEWGIALVVALLVIVVAPVAALVALLARAWSVPVPTELALACCVAFALQGLAAYGCAAGLVDLGLDPPRPLPRTSARAFALVALDALAVASTSSALAASAAGACTCWSPGTTRR